MYLCTASAHGDGMFITPKGVPPEYAQISEGIGRLATIEAIIIAIIIAELLSSVLSAVFQLAFARLVALPRLTPPLENFPYKVAWIY